MPLNWDQMDVVEQLHFAKEWESNPQAQWDQVRTVDSTLEVLGILAQIAEHRANIELHEAMFPPPSPDTSEDFISQINSSLPDETLRAAKLADTDGVVQSDPRHAGGWWGLLTISETSITVTASDPNSTLRMPPGASSFMAAFEMLTTTARGSGSAGFRAAPQGMIDFANGQRASAGSSRAMLHMATTLNYLLASNADDLAHSYLLALRGHGTEEPGRSHSHHLADMVAARSDVDEQLTEILMRDSFYMSLTRFPQIFSATGTSSRTWPGLISRHLHRWKVSTGNHRNALRWIDQRVQSALQTWSDTDAMADRLVGSRTSEHTESEALTVRITRLRREVSSIRSTLTEARSQTTSQERIETLTSAKTTVRGWRSTFGTALSNSLTSRGVSETTVSGDGGFDIIVADVTLDLTEKIIVGLEAQLSSTISMENEQSGSTSETESSTTTGRLGQHWTNLLQESRSFEQQVVNEQTRQRSFTQSVNRVMQIRDIHQQVRDIHAGIRQYAE